MTEPTRCTLAALRYRAVSKSLIFFSFLRESAPGFDRAYLLEIAPQMGVRHTRRVLGDYQLIEADVLICAASTPCTIGFKATRGSNEGVAW